MSPVPHPQALQNTNEPRAVNQTKTAPLPKNNNKLPGQIYKFPNGPSDPRPSLAPRLCDRRHTLKRYPSTFPSKFCHNNAPVRIHPILKSWVKCKIINLSMCTEIRKCFLCRCRWVRFLQRIRSGWQLWLQMIPFFVFQNEEMFIYK